MRGVRGVARGVIVGLAAAVISTTSAVLIPRVAQAAFTTDIVGPAGSTAFGETVTVLANGNLVVIDSKASAGGYTNAGQISLYNGLTHALINTVTGSYVGDQVGSGQLIELPNSNFVVASPLWSSDRGAVTWINGTTGLSGIVSAANSAVGSQPQDEVGSSALVALANGNYVIGSSHWANSSTTSVGAATWAPSTGLRGPITPMNSLIGAVADDGVGYKIQPLSNGHYVVVSASKNGSAASAGAVTWANGTTGRTGVVSFSNSLVGTHALDYVGRDGITEVAGGNYVVASTTWDYTSGMTTILDAGAVTWAKADGTTTGDVTAANSLHGDSDQDRVGSPGVTALTSGNYVVASSGWDYLGADSTGAITWRTGSGASASQGSSITNTNSMIGNKQYDRVGSGGVRALANGNYVALSPGWGNGSASGAGAVTWGHGTGGTTGIVSQSNSLIGTQDSDGVGTNFIELTNGNYVVSSGGWANGSATSAGAVTWGSGTTGVKGIVSAANSMVGNAGDGVGSGLVALLAGSYVVASPAWDNGTNVDVGAVTWVEGSAASLSSVSASNSLVGSTAGDRVGDVTALPDGDYVVTASSWTNAAGLHVGAATQVSGSGPTAGVVSPANSVVGSSVGDFVGGGGVRAFPDSGYAILSPSWQNAAGVRVGAVTYAAPHGVHGTVSPANSVIGAKADDVKTVADAYIADGSVAVPRPLSNIVTLLGTALTAPAFSGTPPDVSAVTAPGVPSTPVAYSLPAATSAGPAPAVQCSPASGSPFPVDTTTVSCTAVNAGNLTASTSFHVTVTPGADYVPLTPARIADTREGFTTVDGLVAGTGPLTAGATLELPVAGRGGVTPDAIAVTLNVTVTGPAASGFVTVWPCGSPQPTASNLNYDVGTTIPNSVITKIGAGGKVCVFTSQQLQLVVDVNGSFPPQSTVVALNPARLLDTRASGSTVDGLQQATGSVTAGSTTTLQVAGRAGVPGDARAVVLNVTVTEPAAAGYATVYPCGTTPPTASNLNYAPGQTIPNLVVAKLGVGGNVCIYTQSATHLIADLGGYFPVNATYTALDPARVLDTREGFATVDGASAGAGLRPAGTVTMLHVHGRGGVPENATTVVLNVTVTGAEAAGYVTVYPCGIDPPLASNLNFVAAQNIPNAVLTQIGSNGDVCLFNSQPTHLVADVNGYIP
ncbi:MAG: hypothetical protein JWM34_552 [Ilumatobacteraceae bacterium]|nr:hypothetical protein [Ilumatobacteraceae bacterium]